MMEHKEGEEGGVVMRHYRPIMLRAKESDRGGRRD